MNPQHEVSAHTLTFLGSCLDANLYFQKMKESHKNTSQFLKALGLMEINGPIEEFHQRNESFGKQLDSMQKSVESVITALQKKFPIEVEMESAENPEFEMELA